MSFGSGMSSTKEVRKIVSSIFSHEMTFVADLVKQLIRDFRKYTDFYHAGRLVFLSLDAWLDPNLFLQSSVPFLTVLDSSTLYLTGKEAKILQLEVMMCRR